MLKNIRQLVRGITSASLILLASGVLESAHAYCVRAPIDWSEVPVRLHADLHNQMRHADGTPWTRSELRYSVSRVISRLNDSAGANIPHVYLETSGADSNCGWLDNNCTDGMDSPSIPRTCPISGAVHIVPVNCGVTYWYTAGGGQIIQIQRSDSTHPGFDQKPWDHAPPGDVFELVLMHEFGHVLGLLHPQDCPDTHDHSSICPSGSEPCSVMGAIYRNVRAQEYFMPDDRAGLRAIYGPRPKPIGLQFQSVGLSRGVWKRPLEDVDAQGYFAASSYLGLSPTSVTLAGYRSDAELGSPVVYSWDGETHALAPVGMPSGHFSNGPIGAAQSGVYHFVTSSTYRMTDDARRWRRRITTSRRRLDQSSGWRTVRSDPSVDAIDDTVTAGISAAYDMQRAAVLYAFRASDGRILLQAGTTGTPRDTGVISEGSPSIACAPITGLNCILVSVEPGRPMTTSTAPRLRWFKFSWNPVTQWTLGDLKTESWIINSGDPQVAVYRRGVEYDYVVTFRAQMNAYTHVFMLRKPAGTNSEFAYWDLLTSTSDITTHAASGSALNLEVFLLSQ